jgi:Arc/MetJ family transcription regulator
MIHINTYNIEYTGGVKMRTTLNIDDELLEKATKITGIKEKTSLVRMGLEALIARESSKRLARMGGTEENLEPISRRRSEGA